MTSGPALAKRKAIAIIVLCQVAALALWFSATAAIPSLIAEFDLSPGRQSLLTSAVQAGFVLGSLLSALLGLADRLDPRRFFMCCALAGAAFNLAILAVDPTSFAVVGLRFLTGMALAGVYPVGMKLAASWAEGDMGMLVGLLVGALTLGSAAPHLFNALGGIDWRWTMALASASAILGALAINLAGIGPRLPASPVFRASFVLRAWSNRALRYANLGYLGHMWELYAMWAWIGSFLQASYLLRLAPEEARLAGALSTFAVIAVGAVGCLAGGFLADRVGRTTVTMGAMAISGLCAATVGLAFAGPLWLLLFICIVWGVSVVADSAQFSASVAELSESGLVGTMLTLQTSLGFLLTLLTIHLMPGAVEWLGWNHAFAILAIGPFLGVLAMWRLRQHPDSSRLAGGRR